MSKRKSEKKMAEKKKMPEKKIKADKNKFGKSNQLISKELRKKIGAEKNPDAVIAEALENYYGGQKRRNENALQKEIDNNIIEIQRRHISDLKDQLEASNKNYEELMKTYQAYMLQVQPLVEAAKIQKPQELESLKKNEPESTAEKTEMKNKKWYEFWK
ncbi:hypothetical protein MmiEs2_01720 [Methanimicrococcus stummii]|uniref:Uncharacterized protein n=1 Tax=Methanimicrococcus stummii TaxID=3028294 RepID=A0AA96VKF6_9EURY|nr:hypothetical protein [Methanimicrococcus sp. Es2]WNY27992.1 hypothetical protein MmiEs2_01720 [Methanimicrococcus sp. Es2]